MVAFGFVLIGAGDGGLAALPRGARSNACEATAGRGLGAVGTVLGSAGRTGRAGSGVGRKAGGAGCGSGRVVGGAGTARGGSGASKAATTVSSRVLNALGSESTANSLAKARTISAGFGGRPPFAACAS